MRAAFSKAEIESALSTRFADAFRHHEAKPLEAIPSGMAEIDSLPANGLPRGGIAEVFGPASSGRTSFMLSALAHATNHDEVCALVDTNNTFDPESASQSQVNFDRLLWIRCANNLEHAFKATDLLMQGGGFGLVILDLGDVAAKQAKRIISSWWYRFRRTLEATPTVLIVIAEESCVRSCAALTLQLKKEGGLWSSANLFPGEIPTQFRGALGSSLQSSPSHSKLLRGLQFKFECQRPLYFQDRTGKVLCNANC